MDMEQIEAARAGPAAAMPVAELTGPVLAVPRPAHSEIALFVPGRDGPGCCVISAAEARALHDVLGAALGMLDRPGELPR